MIIRTAYTTETSPASAVDALTNLLYRDSARLILFFISPHLDNAEISRRLSLNFPNTIIAGCTTAGEICSTGFLTGSVTAVSFAGDDFAAGVEMISSLRELDYRSIKNSLESCFLKLKEQGRPYDENKCFAITLIDGSSFMEEKLVSALALAAPGIKIVGGSASDHRQMNKIRLFLNGNTYTDSAILIIFQTESPFVVFNRHHFLPTNKEVVVTAADMNGRIISKINGHPALDYYSSILNIPKDLLKPEMTVQNPFGYEVDGKYYIRSVVAFRGDNLVMASAVAEGVVLTLMQSGDMLENTAALMEDLNKQLHNNMSFIICFNCLGRYEEGVSRNINTKIINILNLCPLAGFNTYGEQFSSLHLNHSLTGIAFGG